jgi:cell fate (sporulation/competence/biofilm development) regulator YlbF (YheA/YmcA/DUF963 family)
MLNPDEQSVLHEKTMELCHAILDQPAMVAARQQIDAFMNDERSRSDYQALVSKGQSLQDKQERSVALSDQEISDFESHRQRVLDNPVAAAFLDAQQTIQELKHSVNKCVSMALDNGRVPTAEDLETASCGHGCNCH